jgi:hypothetical protein
MRAPGWRDPGGDERASRAMVGALDDAAGALAMGAAAPCVETDLSFTRVRGTDPERSHRRCPAAAARGACGSATRQLFKSLAFGVATVIVSPVAGVVLCDAD